MSPAADDKQVLIVDDTLLYRMLLKESVTKMAGFAVMDTAENGAVALEKIRARTPDAILLDIEMPVMNGLELLSILKQEYPEIPTLIVSAVAKANADVTMTALSRGAKDYITKPSGSSVADSKQMLLDELNAKLPPLTDASRVKRQIAIDRVHGIAPPSAAGNLPKLPGAVEALPMVRRHQPEAIVIGISTGGPDALNKLIPALNAGLPPIYIVQHMPGPFITALAQKLDSKSALTVKEATHGDQAQRDHVYIGPAGTQFKISKQGLHTTLLLTDDPAENHCLPAADYLFRSAAEDFGRKTLGIVMTGMGNDGAKGMVALKAGGALCVAQDEASCTIFGMPKQAIKEGGAQYVLSLDDIRDTINACAL